MADGSSARSHPRPGLARPGLFFTGTPLLAMLTRLEFQNHPFHGPVHEGALALQRDGHYLRRGVLSPDEVEDLRHEVLEVYRTVPPDLRAGRVSVEDAEMYRYEMFNRSWLVQRVVARRELLDVVEPLLGQDCHLVNCTAWRNPPGNEDAPDGLYWHVDGGPHVPRRADVPWPAEIPYPVFVIATHVYLQDVERADGPTAFVNGSHTSGRIPPRDRRWHHELDYGGGGCVAHLARAGDVGFFVSDVWHRRLPPAPEGRGRFFLQSNYGRREIAQRILPPDEVSHARPHAIERARDARELELIGVHPQCFYDG